jgi:hypothetical protein
MKHEIQVLEYVVMIFLLNRAAKPGCCSIEPEASDFVPSAYPLPVLFLSVATCKLPYRAKTKNKEL